VNAFAVDPRAWRGQWLSARHTGQAVAKRTSSGEVTAVTSAAPHKFLTGSW